MSSDSEAEFEWRKEKRKSTAMLSRSSSGTSSIVKAVYYKKVEKAFDRQSCV